MEKQNIQKTKNSVPSKSCVMVEKSHPSTQFMHMETAYRQATKCPCPYQWKSNTPKYPFV